MQPRDVRDVAIECAARLGGTAFTVRESCTEDFKRYRRACGFTMAAFATSSTPLCVPILS